MNTASDGQLGPGKWSAGPTAVVLLQPKPRTLDLLQCRETGFGPGLAMGLYGSVSVPQVKGKSHTIETTLNLTGKKAGEVDMPEMHISTFSLSETFDVGIDAGTPVSNKYRVTNHYPFTGELDKVVVTLTE